MIITQMSKQELFDNVFAELDKTIDDVEKCGEKCDHQIDEETEDIAWRLGQIKHYLTIIVERDKDYF